jgi:hypothetical protein
VRTAIETVIIEVQLTKAERMVFEKITGGKVLDDARLEVKVQVHFKNRKRESAIMQITPIRFATRDKRK